VNNRDENRKEKALGQVYDSIMDALMNENVTMDELTAYIQSRLKEYRDLGRRLTRHKERRI
jgi:hypothetical protein